MRSFSVRENTAPAPCSVKRVANEPNLTSKFGFRPRTAGVCGVGVSRELNHLCFLQHERILEPLSNLEQCLPAHFGSPALSTCGIAIATAGEWLANALGPEADTVEAFADVHHDTHDFAVVLVLERFTNGGEHNVQPQVVDVDGFLVLELEGPFSTVFVLNVFPFGADARLEEVIIGLLGEFRGWGDVVLCRVLLAMAG